MAVFLGLDIGTNSVGSAWVDTDKRVIHLGVSVFPAGVDEQENKRGAPKNQARREKRSQRRSLARRSARKRHLRRLLVERGLLPAGPDELQALFDGNRWPPPGRNCRPGEDYTVWHLRREGLRRELHPYEFGRVLVHLNQRRGAVGIETDPDDPDEGKVKEAIDRLEALMSDRKAETVGQLFADLMDERRQTNQENGKSWQEPIRNRQYRIDEQQQLYADRPRVREEFARLWERQKSFGGALAALLTDELRRRLDEPGGDEIWRHKGVLFGQRHTYWDTGTLGRCDLEPTERCVPIADRHASYFRVVETANNIRITKRGEPERALLPEERQKVVDALQRQKTGSVATIRKALGIDKKAVKEFYTLNIERDKDREVNTDWFYCEIVHGVWSEERWKGLSERQRESVNRAVLKFDILDENHRERLRTGAQAWWGLSGEEADRLVGPETWWQWVPKDNEEKKQKAEGKPAMASRPRLEDRLRLSRRAIRNLLPYMEELDVVNKRWPTQIEARQRFAEDADAVDRTTGNPATPEQRQRYTLGTKVMRRGDRQYLRKHDEPIPPAPMLSNPVVRKAIHEVRRHLIAYWRKFGRTPDRIVIEYVRSATQPATVRNEMLGLIRKRNGIKNQLVRQFELGALTGNQQERAIERILLCRQQKGLCAYAGGPISEKAAADGRDVEVDHIVPKSRSQDNGFNNKVLVKREANRGKGNATVKEWMNRERFAAMEQRLAHLEKGESPDDYFTKKDCARKWENLHREAPSTDEFLASQFTDTAYAAKQVGQWLREVLYDGEGDGTRHVFTTKGSYTSILRNDWGLSESELDRQWHSIVEPGEAEGDNRSRRARKQKNKERCDHLHHAIDAVCIAFAPDRLQDLARFAEEQEKARAQLGHWPRRRALRPPWPSVPATAEEEQMSAATGEFRKQVLGAAGRLVVCHRPVKCRIAGKLHEEQHYGPVVGPMPRHRTEDRDTLFTNRIPLYESSQKWLTPNHLRVPEGWDELSARLEDPMIADAEKKSIRRELAALPDPPPGKSGIVRDRAVREQIRKCLRNAGLDLGTFDSRRNTVKGGFSSDEVRRLVEEGGIRMASGVPIKSVVLLRTNADPVILARKRWDPAVGRMVGDSDPRSARVYVGGNNHHVEIRKRTRNRKGESVVEWCGEVVTTFEAGRRNTARLGALKEAGVPTGAKWRKLPKQDRQQFRRVLADINRRFPIVDRTDKEDGQFVMSLAEGETVHMRHPDTGEPGYFVVFKLDKPSTIHFIHHWDARGSKVRKDDEGEAIPKSHREDIRVAVVNLKGLGVAAGEPPHKVRVGALGDVRRLTDD